MRTDTSASEFGRTPKVGGEMNDCRRPEHEEAGALRVFFYLLAALSIGICVSLLIIVERL